MKGSLAPARESNPHIALQSESRLKPRPSWPNTIWSHRAQMCREDRPKRLPLDQLLQDSNASLPCFRAVHSNRLPGMKLWFEPVLATSKKWGVHPILYDSNSSFSGIIGRFCLLPQFQWLPHSMSNLATWWDFRIEMVNWFSSTH